MPSRRGRRVLIAALATIAVACSPGTLDTATGSSPRAEPGVDPPATDAPTSDPPATDAPTTDPMACGPDVDAAVNATIAGQLDAFAADDYAGALGFASRDFQASTDVAGFRQLIDGSYPEVADSVGHRVAGCLLVAEGVAHAVVDVTGREGGRVEMLYVLVAEGGAAASGWAVAAAASRPAEPGIRA